MDDIQLDRLRTLEHDLLVLHRAATALAVSAWELHDQAAQLLLTELARPLNTTETNG